MTTDVDHVSLYMMDLLPNAIPTTHLVAPAALPMDGAGKGVLGVHAVDASTTQLENKRDRDRSIWSALN